jgi:CRISPR-associated endonuclease/helicase Cas3
MTLTLPTFFSLPSFPHFFRALWGFDPFPWQAMLAERLSGGAWPQALDLPTAAGKTACIDVALYALAAQVEQPTAARTAPRRIWFVVDRRIVVDEAYERAEKIAQRLRDAREGPLQAVAERLRRIAGTERPLAVARLRGGVLRDDGWARLPSQPAVITSTVDQLGSRLLFRGYGPSSLSAPMFAGLAAHDSLILLDEAHCSVPFLQTLRVVESYRGGRWAERAVTTPFSFVILSATPPADIAGDAVFPGSQRESALDHPLLRQRLEASKRAELVEVSTKARGEDPLVREAAARATSFVRSGKSRVVVMVNRVRTAEALADELASTLQSDGDSPCSVVLFTGRMRPFERDRLVENWKRYLKADSPEQPPRPIVLVSTQCLEVGADFSFEGLVTEAASLDALRQRFGRLDRMGRAGVSPAVILIRDRDADPEKAEPDAIYEAALARTWRLLKANARENVIDFGVEALRSNLGDVEEPQAYAAPANEAPVLLPAHLDMLCQTAPRPEPEPDVSLFLHGKGASAPEVSVLWRADLDVADDRQWLETVALCPPVSGEMLSVPLFRLRAFLTGSVAEDDSGDVEGSAGSMPESPPHGFRRCLLWRGRERSKVARDPEVIKPGDVVVLPEVYGMEGLGQSAATEALGAKALDIWEPALTRSGRPKAIRLHPSVLAPWREHPAVRDLLTALNDEERNAGTIGEAIDALLSYETANAAVPAGPPKWWRDLLRELHDPKSRARMEEHPSAGVVLVAPRSRKRFRQAEPDLFADDDDLMSAAGEEISLDDHSKVVRRTAEKLAGRCLPEEYRAVVSLAAYWHDVGKLDERFQLLLHQGNELRLLSGTPALAKSADVPSSPARRRFIYETSKLPRGFRHEMLSVQLAGVFAPKAEDPATEDLFLHLVASHHGHGRPLAPVVLDPKPPAISGKLGDRKIELTAADREALSPPHRVDSGIADRFWRLTRRHGWWGLAYLEAIVRLADWYASGFTEVDDDA